MKRKLLLPIFVLFTICCKKQDAINPSVLQSPNVQIFPLIKYIGDPTFKFEFNSLSSAPFKISSTNQSVATINKDSIKVMGIGSSKIELIQDANETFAGITLSTELTVKNRIAVAIEKMESYVIYLSDGETKLPTPKSNSFGSFTFSASDQTIAQINGSNIKPLKVGKVKITANQSVSGDFGQGQVEFEIDIREKIDFSGIKLQSVFSTELLKEYITDFCIDNDGVIVFSSFIVSSNSPLPPTYDYYVNKIDKNGKHNKITLSGFFKKITSIECDEKGNIFVADGDANKIFKIDKNNVISNFAGNGTKGFSDGIGTEASFNFPNDLKFDKNGDLIVADLNNQIIRAIKPNGLTNTLVGMPLKSGSVNGDKTQATLLNPSKVAINNDNEIFVVDGNSKRIRKIDINGNVTIFLGSLNSGNFDGNINTASFEEISDLDFHNNVLLIGDGSTTSKKYLRYSSQKGLLSTSFNINTVSKMMFFVKNKDEVYISEAFGTIYKLITP